MQSRSAALLGRSCAPGARRKILKEGTALAPEYDLDNSTGVDIEEERAEYSYQQWLIYKEREKAPNNNERILSEGS